MHLKIRTYLRQLTKDVLFARIATLSSGIAIAQLIAILFQLVLRRIFSVEDFGVFAVYMSVLGVLVIIPTLKYERAIVIEEDDTKAAHLWLLSIIFSLGINLMILLLIYLFGDLFLKILAIPVNFKSWLFILPASLFAYNVYEATNYWLIRRKAFRYSATTKIIRRSSEGAVQWLGAKSFYHFGLVIGDLTGNFFNAASAIVFARKTGLKLVSPGIKNLVSVAGKYKNFPKYNLFPTLLNAFSLLLPVFIVNHVFSSEETGYYELSRMVLALPAALLTASISQVLLQHGAEARKNGKVVMRSFFSPLRWLIPVTIVGIVVIELWSEPIFTFLFSDTWRLSAQITNILVFSYAIKFLVSPFSAAFIAFEKLKIQAVWQLIYFAGLTSLFFLSNIDLMQFFTLLMGIDVLFYLIYFFLIVHVIKKFDKSCSVA